MVARFANPPMGYFCAKAAGELGQLIDTWRDPAIRAVVLTGSQGHFITHYSVQELVDFGADQAAMQTIGTALSDGYHALLARLAALPVPVIAAIDGDCMGGGFELAMWCDIRISCTADIRIGLPESRLGIMPGGSGTQMLARLIGAARAREMILLGTLVTPAEAHRLGLVTMLAVDPVMAALVLGARFATMNPSALANIKRAASADEAALSAGLSLEAQCFLDTMRAPQSLDTMRRYLAVAPDMRRRWLDA